MKIKICSNSFVFIFFLFLVTGWLSVEAHTHKPSGKIRGKKDPEKQCNKENLDKCSPKVSHRTKAILTLNSFQKGGDGGGPSECDNKFHSDNIPLVALSTGWFNHKRRCSHKITIYGNGRSVNAMVVDECDSTRGCANNIVDASKAVWKALGVPKKNWGLLHIYWSDV